MSRNETIQEVYHRAKQRIPGGTQLLSKRPEMFAPEQWPSYYRKAKGAEVWDLDGRRYYDMSYNGIGACVLGFADPDVDRAVTSAIETGSMATLNCIEDVELADLLCGLHPWAEMARFARTGGEAMAVAVRIARARSGRDKLAFCGYHGWHDWYISANLNGDAALDGHLLKGLDPRGVPRCLEGTTFPFKFNDIDALCKILTDNRGAIGAIIMEPIRNELPRDGFIEKVRDLATDQGVILVFDEITAGWRANSGGYHLNYSVNPDIAVFGKAMSNGYPMAAIIGTADVMQSAQSTFISSTYWTERLGPTAAIATIEKHKRLKVYEHLEQTGMTVISGWKRIAENVGLDIETGSNAVPSLAHFCFKGDSSQEKRTFFTQQMLDKGFLATPALYATYAHTDKIVQSYLEAVGEVFEQIQKAETDNSLQSRLRGPVAHTGFQRLN